MKKLTNDKVELQKSIAYRKNRVRVYLLGQKTPWNLFLLRLGTSQNSNHSVYPPFLLEGWGGGWASDQNFKKRGGLTGSQFLEEVGGKEKSDFFQGAGGRRVGCSFFIKNKLKSLVFNDRKVYKQKCFSLSLLNWEILTKNLVTFKRWDRVKDEKC